MDKELRDLLEENLHIAKDNNRLLREARRSARLAFVGKIIFWIIVLGIPTYLYVTYLAPVISNMAPKSGASQNVLLNALGLPSGDSLQQMLDTATQQAKRLPATP
ncbi:MAG TPA: hypothetical protein VF829_01430 [Candidatus Paceibacterota bacterium]